MLVEDVLPALPVELRLFSVDRVSEVHLADRLGFVNLLLRDDLNDRFRNFPVNLVSKFNGEFRNEIQKMFNDYYHL